MNDHIIPVSFHGDTLAIVGHDGEPFVAMKPVVENVGLSWEVQHRKLTEKFGSVITKMVTTGGDGKQYEMICLPLRKFPAWLYSIHVNKVKSELREKIIRYQDECDDVLWQYWTQGYVERTGGKRPSVSQQLAAHGVRLRLLDKLELERHPDKRLAIHQQLEHASRLLGLLTPALNAIGHEAKPAAESPLIADFWEVIALLLGGDDEHRLNHARADGLMALNLLQVERAAKAARLSMPRLDELRRVLRHSQSPRFVDMKSVNSRHGGTVKCWVFENEDGEEV